MNDFHIKLHREPTMIASPHLFRTRFLLAAALSLNLITAPLALANTPERYEAAVGEKVTAMLDGDPKQAVACTVIEEHGVGRMIKVDATGKKFYVLNRWVRPLGETVSVAAKPAEPLNQANGDPIFYEPAIGEKVIAMRNGDPNDSYECIVLGRYGKGSTVRTVKGGIEFVSPDRFTRPLPGAAKATHNAAAETPTSKPANNAATNASPAQPVNGSKGLSGLYLRHEQSFQGTSISYREDHYYFFPDGRVYHGVPPEGPSNFNWAKEMRENPLKCGTYGINGNKITFSWTGGSSYTWPMRNDARGMEINMSPTNKVEKFGSNAKLSGSYHRGTVFGANYSYGAAPTITKAGIYTFASNGSFSTDSTKGLGGDTNDTGVTVGIYQKGQGTYTINGNDMVLTLGGEVKRCTVYPVTDNGNLQAPVRISINGALFERGK
jgi:hypothetical protein